MSSRLRPQRSEILLSVLKTLHTGKPKFRAEPRTRYSAYLGHSIKLRCPVSGTDDHQENRTLVAWAKGATGMNIIQNSNARWSRFFQKNDKHLKIVNVKAEDAGIYRCLARNPFGSVNLVISLKVQGTRKPGRGKPPKFKQSPKKRKTYWAGETAILQCHSTGVPDPNVQWFKDGKSYGIGKRTSVGKDGWTLNLRYLTVEHTGNYTCRVSNNVGSINRTFTVIVKARTNEPIIEKPEVYKLEARRGRSVKFECRAISVRGLVFKWKWTRNNANSSAELKISNKLGSKYIGNHTKMPDGSLTRYNFDGFLVIRDVRKEDEGTYTCLVQNGHGSDEFNFYLRVKGKGPQTTTLTPTVVTTQQKVQTTERMVIPVKLVAVLTASIIVAMVFIVVLIMCCRKQRKDLEKQYINEYQPQDIFQPYTQQTNVYQEMQKFDQNEPRFNSSQNGSDMNAVQISQVARASLQTSENSLGTHSDTKRTNVPSSSSEMYLANSRTSLQTTLCRTCPRETSFDYKGGSHNSLPRKAPSASIPGMFPRGVSSPEVLTTDRDDESRNWESQTSLDDCPRNTSPQRSRESIV